MPSTPPGSYGAPTGEQPGGLMDRFLARLIDFLVLLVPYIVLTLVFRAMFLHGLVYSTGEWLLYNLVSSVVLAALTLGYYAYLESSQGATIGKRAMKLQVRGPGGGHPTMEQSVRRNIFLAFGVLAIVPIVGGFVAGVAQLIAVIMIAVGINGDPARRQAWHDRFAGGTYVVKVPG